MRVAISARWVIACCVSDLYVGYWLHSVAYGWTVACCAKVLHTLGAVAYARETCSNTPRWEHLHERPAGVPQPWAYRQRGRQHACWVAVCCVLQTVLPW